VIESSLMDNLGVHFNAEVSLKTIKNSEEGLKWIKNTFLYQRVLQNPSKYDANFVNQAELDEKLH
jgi:uncharacterized protein YdaL